MKLRRFSAFALALVLALSSVPVGTVRSYAEPVDGTTNEYTDPAQGTDLTDPSETNLSGDDQTDPSAGNNEQGTGYTFGGWYKEASCRTRVGAIIQSPYVDMTIYAKWIPIP